MNFERNQKISNLRTDMLRLGNTPQDRLKGLITIFSSWSEDAEKQKLMQEIALEMDNCDIVAFRNLIQEQVNLLKIKNTEDLTEQILFIVIGAFKFEINRNASSTHWNLAGLSLNSVLSGTGKDKKYYGLNSVLTGSFLVLITAIWIINSQYNSANSKKKLEFEASTQLEPLPQPIPNPYVPSHFYSLREQMGKSICLIPQAPTLPAEQRAAFVNFLNTGAIEMDQLANLQAALSLVHCEYVPLTIHIEH
jgi:hypothetical protein